MPIVQSLICGKQKMKRLTLTLTRESIIINSL